MRIPYAGVNKGTLCLVTAIAITTLWTQGAAAQKSDTETKTIKQQRKETAHRTRRIIFDNDGNEPVYYCDEATPQALLDRRTTALIGSQVDTIVYCTWSSGFSFFTHNTSVGKVFTCKAEEPAKGPESGFSKNKTQEFIEQGTDSLKIMVEFCREHNIEIFWSMRMNDVHDAWGAWYSPFLFPPLKKEHPEWLLGSAEKKPKNGGWTAIDYGVPEIRDLAFRFFEEVCRNYDVDGVEMDFFRHLNYFRRPAEGQPASPEDLENMTDLLRRIRTMADEVGTQRGRPILISARVPDSVEFCKTMGFDLVRWMEEDLIDLLVLSGYFRLSPWEDSVKLGHKYGVPVYPCLSETRIRDKEAATVRGTLECYRARAMNVWNSGADGVYLFNFFDPTSPLWRELGSRETLEPLDKTYTTATRGLGNLDFWFEGGKRFLKRSFVTPDNPRSIKATTSEEIQLRVGEKLSEGTSANVTLRLRFKEGAEPRSFVVKLNDIALPQGSMNGAYLDYPVEPALVKQGMNRIEIGLKPDTQAEALLEDVLLSVQREKNNE